MSREAPAVIVDGTVVGMLSPAASGGSWTDAAAETC